MSFLSLNCNSVSHPLYAELNLTVDETLNPRGCSPRRKIAYLKTHKTAST